MIDLSTDIKFLPGVGPKKAELLGNEAGIFTYEDLLYYFPYKYVDRSKFYTVRELNPNMPYVQVKGKLTSLKTVGSGRHARLTATFSDGTGTMELVWFKGHKYIKDSLDPKAEYIIFGKPSIFNGMINVVHPEMDKVDPAKSVIRSGLQAFYNTTEKMKKGYLNSRGILKLMQNLFKLLQRETIPETMPAPLTKRLKLINLNDALRTAHFPDNTKHLEKAQFRLKFEELFYLQLNILRIKNQRKLAVKCHIFKVVGDNMTTF